ncbi:MAG: ferrous iron transport protein A [Dehalococcoidales bacterium]|nr:ferrous iron transport protein A [Dehalococcoidales bacterium]
MKKKLSEMKYEETGVIKSIGSDLRAQVAGMGIREGKEVKMMSKQPLKGPVVIMVDRSNASIGRGLANKIMVEMKDG